MEEVVDDQDMQPGSITASCVTICVAEEIQWWRIAGMSCGVKESRMMICTYSVLNTKIIINEHIWTSEHTDEKLFCHFCVTFDLSPSFYNDFGHNHLNKGVSCCRRFFALHLDPAITTYESIGNKRKIALQAMDARKCKRFHLRSVHG